MSQNSAESFDLQLRPLRLEIASLARRLERVEKQLLLTPAAADLSPDLSAMDVSERTIEAAPQIAPVVPRLNAPTTVENVRVASAPVFSSPQLTANDTVAAPIASAPLSTVPNTTHAATSQVTQTKSAPRRDDDAKSGGRGWAEWESIVGGQWALWAGVAALFLALALFLAYTWTKLPPAPPWARVMMGVGGGLALIGASEWARTRARREFSEGLCGAGLAMVYLSLWAGAQTLKVLPLGLAFGAMAFTSALGTVLALRYDAQRLLVLATIGGFCTPLLLGSSSRGAFNVNLLIYVALLDAGIVASAVKKKWHGATWFSFVATVLLVGGWSSLQVLAGRELLVWTFCTLYFVLFVGAASFYSLRRQEETAQSDLLLLFAATSVYALGGFALLEPLTRAFPALFVLGLCTFFAAMSRAVGVLAPGNRTLRESATGLAIGFLTVAIPVGLKQSALVISWVIEAAVLLILAQRLNAPLLGRAGQIVWLLSLVPLLGVLNETPRGLLGHGAIPWFNARALTLIFAICATFAVAWNRHRARIVSWSDELAGVYPVATVLGAAWLWAQEIHFALVPPVGAPTDAVLYAAAMAWSTLSVAWFTFGLKTRWLEVRAGALMLAALAWCLPLWTILAHPNTASTPFWNVRVLSFVCVAVHLGILGWLIAREKDAFDENEARTLGSAPVWVALFILLGATSETWFAFAQRSDTWNGAALATIAIVWAVFAALLIALGNAWRVASLRNMALWVGAVAFGLVLLSSLIIEANTPAWNIRALAFALVCGALALSGAQWERGAKSDSSRIVGTYVAVGCGILVLWGGTLEIYSAANFYRAGLGNDWSHFAPLGSIALWMSVALTWIWHGARRDLERVRAVGTLLGGLGLAWLLWAGADASRTAWLPFLNARFAAFLWASATMFGALQVLAAYRERLKQSEIELLRVLGLCAIGLLWWSLTREVWESAWHFRSALGQNWERTAQMGISLWWAASGAGLLSAGIARGQSTWRLLALGLLALTTLKLFGFDLSYLQGVSRILSLGGVGVALVFISWLYSRYGTDAPAQGETGT